MEKGEVWLIRRRRRDKGFKKRGPTLKSMEAIPSICS